MFRTCPGHSQLRHSSMQQMPELVVKKESQSSTAILFQLANFIQNNNLDKGKRTKQECIGKGQEYCSNSVRRTSFEDATH